MKKRDEITQELRELSPLLASVENVNVFHVPDGYFPTIDATIMACIHESRSYPADPAPGKDVPEGYFDGLAANILDKINDPVFLELQQLAPFLAGTKKINPYKVPPDYFENFSKDILPETDPGIVALAEASKTLPAFEIPAGYFNDLPDHILAKINQAAPARLVAMPVWRRVARYATAAAVTGALALGVYQYTQQKAGDNGKPPVQMAAQSAELAPGIISGQSMDEKKFNETLSNLNEDDIAQYLEKNGSYADLALLTSNVDEGSLPDRDDYLADDETLDKFLESISTEN